MKTKRKKLSHKPEVHFIGQPTVKVTFMSKNNQSRTIPSTSNTQSWLLIFSNNQWNMLIWYFDITHWTKKPERTSEIDRPWPWHFGVKEFHRFLQQINRIFVYARRSTRRCFKAAKCLERAWCEFPQMSEEINDITMTSTEADSSQTHGHEGKQTFKLFSRCLNVYLVLNFL